MIGRNRILQKNKNLWILALIYYFLGHHDTSWLDAFCSIFISGAMLVNYFYYGAQDKNMLVNFYSIAYTIRYSISLSSSFSYFGYDFLAQFQNVKSKYFYKTLRLQEMPFHDRADATPLISHLSISITVFLNFLSCSDHNVFVNKIIWALVTRVRILKIDVVSSTNRSRG